jgi:hypothetical protein
LVCSILGRFGSLHCESPTWYLPSGFVLPTNSQPPDSHDKHQTSTPPQGLCALIFVESTSRQPIKSISANFFHLANMSGNWKAGGTEIPYRCLPKSQLDKTHLPEIRAIGAAIVLAVAIIICLIPCLVKYFDGHGEPESIKNKIAGAFYKLQNKSAHATMFFEVFGSVLFLMTGWVHVRSHHTIVSNIGTNKL